MDGNNEVNYLDIIRQGASVEKKPSKTPQADPLQRFYRTFETQGQTSSQDDPLKAFKRSPMRGEPEASNTSKSIQDPLSSRQANASPAKPEPRPPSPLRNDTTSFSQSQNPASSVQRPPTPDRRSPSPILIEDQGRASLRREASKSPQRIPEVDRFNRQSPASNTFPERVDQQPEFRESLSRQEYKLSNRQSLDPVTARNFDKFSQHYRQQDSSRQTLKAGIETFKKKSREELKKEFEQINTKKNLAILGFILSLFALVIIFGMFLSSIRDSRPYCDSGRQPTPDCKACPHHGVCKNGHLIDCENYYYLQGDICVKKEKNQKLIYTLYHDAVDVLRRTLGDFNLGDRQNAELPEKIVEEYLYIKYSSLDDYFDSKNEVLVLMRDNNPDISLEMKQGQSCFLAKTPSYSPSGWLRIFFISNKVSVFIFVFGLLVCGAIVMMMNAELARRNFAKKACCLIEEIIFLEPRKCKTEEDLKKRLAFDMKKTRTEINSLWDYVRYEAESRQIFDFSRRVIDGMEQTIWTCEFR